MILENIQMYTHQYKRKKYNDDVVNFNQIDNGITLYIADGATGIGEGRFASRMFADKCHQVRKILKQHELLSLIFEIEYDIMHSKYDCDTTGIFIQIDDKYNLSGVSVGDSEAFIFRDDDIINLTKNQKRKPRIGNLCKPVCFENKLEKNDKIFMATDGVLNLLGIEEIKSNMIDLNSKIKDATDDASFILASGITI